MYRWSLRLFEGSFPPLALAQFRFLGGPTRYRGHQRRDCLDARLICGASHQFCLPFILLPVQGQPAGQRDLLLDPWHPRFGLLRDGSDGLRGHIPAMPWSA